MLSKLQKLKEERETGFTLIELLVVILIIGILAAIAIPAFLNQRKAAVDASVESDVSNAAKQVETVALKAGGTVESFELGEFNDGKAVISLLDNATTGIETHVSKGTELKMKGNTNGYCIHGSNEGGDVANDSGFTYSSLNGGLKKDGGDCTIGSDGSAIYVPGSSWTGGNGGSEVDEGEEDSSGASNSGEFGSNSSMQVEIDQMLNYSDGTNIHIDGFVEFDKGSSVVKHSESLVTDYKSTTERTFDVVYTSDNGESHTSKGSVVYGKDGPSMSGKGTFGYLDDFSASTKSISVKLVPTEGSDVDDEFDPDALEVLNSTVDVWDWRNGGEVAGKANVSYDPSTGIITIDAPFTENDEYKITGKVSNMDDGTTFNEMVDMNNGKVTYDTNFVDGDEFSVTDLQYNPYNK